jgi:hypothetical protein
MDSGSPRSLLDRLLAVTVTICVIAVLLVVAVHLIESVAVELLIGVVIAGGIGGAVWLIRGPRNRYW